MDLGYIKVGSGKDNIILRCNIPEGINIDVENSTIQFPRYRSWAGFWGWLDTLKKNVDFPEHVLKIALLNPEDSFDWVLKYSKDDLEEVFRNVSPFTGVIPTPKDIERYFKIWKRRGFFLRTYLEGKENIERWHPRSYKHYCACVDSKGHPLVVRNAIKWWKYSQYELMALNIYGVISNTHTKLVELCKYNIPTEIIIAINKYLKEHNKYIFEITLEDIVKSGITHKEIFPYLTKKRRASVWENRCDDKIINFDMIGLVYDEQIPDNVFYHIKEAMYNNGGKFQIEDWMMLVKWAIRNKDKLNQSRVVHGPENAEATIYYRELVREITPDMLVNGSKTAWRIVMDKLQEKIDARIKVSIASNNKEFKNPPDVIKETLKDFSDVRRLESSLELNVEGNKMAHCVGGYVEHCASYKTHIFHIGPKAPDGATFEVFKKDKWVLAQIHSYQDMIPSKVLKDRADQFVNKLNKKEVI